MATPRFRLGLVALLVLVTLSGCAGLFGDTGASQETPTLTPAPVPDTTGPSERWASIRPTCTRPPGLVVHVQVDALANNDPETNAGIRTTWAFAAPENREYTGPYGNFERMISSFYRPLLEAETITYRPVNRTDGRAQRDVTVTTANGTTATYEWSLARQSGGEYDGCWMTVGVREFDPAPEPYPG